MILRLLDALLQIPNEEIASPNYPSTESACKRQEAVLRELQAEMRALRETELKMVPLFFQICAFILAGNLVVLGSANAKVSFALCAFMSLASVLFVIAFWFQLHVRLAHDNGTYRFLGKRVLAIREVWGVSEFLKPPESRKALGAGQGFRMNQRLLAFSALSVSGILLGAMALRFQWYWPS